MYNTVNGGIVADSNLSPGEMASCGPIVKLRAWSDVVYLQWQKLCKVRRDPVSNLNWVIRSHMENELTQTIVRQALGLPRNFKSWDKMPKKTFRTGESQFRALLATPNGRGTPYLLIQHKNRNQLGVRKVSEITVQPQNLNGKWLPMMIQKIEAVTPSRS